MLLSRLFGWIERHNTLHIFLLEILAVFIGITASLLIDGWRQERSDLERFDAIIQQVYNDALHDRAALQSNALLEFLSLESVVALDRSRADSLTDEHLAMHLERALRRAGVLGSLDGTERLRAASQSIAVERTVSEIEYNYFFLRRLNGDLAPVVAEANDTIEAIAKYLGLTPQMRRIFLGPLPEEDQRLVFSMIDRLAKVGTTPDSGEELATLRSALDRPEFKTLLKRLIRARQRILMTRLYRKVYVEAVIHSVRRYNSDITLPINVIGLDGSATEFGWSEATGPGAGKSIPMQRRPGHRYVWQVDVELGEGAVKFRADNNWAINWGARPTLDNMSTRDFTLFTGDPATVFPTGVAAFDGLNIPVEPGRYRVTFNSRTFDYSFEPLEAIP